MLLQELIRIDERGQRFISARDLHEWICVSDNFSRWLDGSLYSARWGFKKFVLREEKCQETSKYAREGSRPLTMKAKEVYVKLAKNKGTTFERKLFKDYELSFELAKNLAMVSGSIKGQEARDYFIECEQQLIKLTESNLKLGSMLLTHKDKLNLTKELFYPILEQLGVLITKKNAVHQMIIKSIFGKYENVNKLTMITEEDIENYKKLAINLQKDTVYFEDKNQITVWDIIKEM